MTMKHIEESICSPSVAVPALFEVIVFIYLMIFTQSMNLFVNSHSLCPAWPFNGNFWLVKLFPAFGVC